MNGLLGGAFVSLVQREICLEARRLRRRVCGAFIVFGSASRLKLEVVRFEVVIALVMMSIVVGRGPTPAYPGLELWLKLGNSFNDDRLYLVSKLQRQDLAEYVREIC